MRAITKEMHDKELQPYYGAGRIVAWLASRAWGARILQSFMYLGRRLKPIANHCESDQIYIPSQEEEHKIRVRIFRPRGTKGQKLPAVLYVHGGGFMMGLPEEPMDFYEELLKRRKVVIISPDYRLSLKHPFPAGFNDCYDTLLWMKDNADELNIYNDKFVLAGHSAGGGMVAALTLKARDTKDVKIAFQMPIYPMIDYRMDDTRSSKCLDGCTLWSRESNAYAWKHYLKGLVREHAGEQLLSKIPCYASAALNTDYTDLPPTITYVGDLDPFRDDTLAYIEALQKAGIPTKIAVFPGACHGFDNFVPGASVSKSAISFGFDAFDEYFDQYVKAVA